MSPKSFQWLKDLIIKEKCILFLTHLKYVHYIFSVRSYNNLHGNHRLSYSLSRPLATLSVPLWKQLVPTTG